MTFQTLRMAVLSGVAAIALASGAALAKPVSESIGTPLKEAYAQSIYKSSVKQPDFRKRLLPIGAKSGKVTVISLTRKSDPPDQIDVPFPQDKGYVHYKALPGTKGKLIRNTWISQPDELQPKCQGAADPLLALQMLLGMPPEGGKWELVRFSVATKHIFRPCASGPSITGRRCSFQVPTNFSDDGKRAAFLETQQFVFQQMWSSYTEGFQWPGYPFTGMGWSYNWDPAAESPYGISEYVVRLGAPISNIETVSPQAFCRTP